MSGTARQTPEALFRAIDAYLATYHRHDIHVDGAVPEEPAFIVSNHGFGGVVDLNSLTLNRTVRALDLGRPVTYLVHQMAWTVGAGPLVEALGGRPGSRDSVDEALAAGHHVAVFPGGDIDAAKPWKDRHMVRFAGRSGFARLAIEHGLPVLPVVTAGAGESLFVLSDGQGLARALRLPKLLRLKALPVNVSFPWGLNVGIAGMLPYAPLPTKLHTAVLPTMRPEVDESAADFAARIEAAMQARLDDLVADRRPVLG